MSRVNALWVVPGAILLSVIGLIHSKSEVPTRSDWARAAQHVRSELKPDDGVTWAPYWAGEGRLFFHDLPAFGAPPDDLDGYHRFRRVWRMSAFGQQHEGQTDHTVEARWQFGGVTLELLTTAQPRSVVSLYTDLPAVTVQRMRPTRVEPCDFWDGRGWHCVSPSKVGRIRDCLTEGTPARLRRFRQRKDPHCGLNPWLNVSRDHRVIGRYPRRCVWLHPVAGAETQGRWRPKVRGQTLHLRFGFADKVVEYFKGKIPRTKPLTLKVASDNHPPSEFVVDPSPGWKNETIDLPSDLTELILSVSTSATVDAHFCLEADIRRGETQ